MLCVWFLGHGVLDPSFCYASVWRAWSLISMGTYLILTATFYTLEDAFVSYGVKCSSSETDLKCLAHPP